MDERMAKAIQDAAVKAYADEVKSGVSEADARKALRAALLAEAEKLDGAFFG